MPTPSPAALHRRSSAWRETANQRKQRAQQTDEPCIRCGAPIDYTLTGRHAAGPTIDHITPLHHGGTDDPDNLAPAHRRCNSRHGAQIINAQRHTTKRLQAPPKATKQATPSPNTDPGLGGLREALTGRVGPFLGGPPDSAAQSGDVKVPPNPPKPDENGLNPQNPGDTAQIGPEYHADGFPLPAIRPDHPANASYDLADEALDWIAGNIPGPPLQPWQRWLFRETHLAIPTPDGLRLAFPTAVWRMSRQQGKTFMARRTLCVRLMRGEHLFGEPQRILSTHPDGLLGRGLMVPLAQSMGFSGRSTGLEKDTRIASWWPRHATTGIGSETEPVWMTRSMTTHGLTGHQGLTASFVDEMQDALEQQVTEALGGALSSPRVKAPWRLFAGTGEKPRSDFLRKMKKLLGRPRVGWWQWSVPPDTDVRDESRWRWASPDWSESRADYLRLELEMMGPREFSANYLLADTVTGVAPWIEPDTLRDLAAPGTALPPSRLTVGIGWDKTTSCFPIVAAGVIPGTTIGVVSVLGEGRGRGEAQTLADSALTGGGGTLVIPRFLRGQFRARSGKLILMNDSDMAAAWDVCSISPETLLRFPPGDQAAAALEVLPRSRRLNVWGAGQMLLLAAWWGSQDTPRSVVA